MSSKSKQEREWKPTLRGRHARNRVAATTIRLRKARKEAQLNRKRGMPTNVPVSTTHNNTNSTVSLSEALQQFLQNPVAFGQPFQTALQTTPSNSLLPFLEQLLQCDEAKCRQLMRCILQHLDHTTGVLLELSSIVRTRPPSQEEEEEEKYNYYGNPQRQLQWSDLLLSAIPTLLQALQQQQQQPSNEALFDILGNIVQDRPEALQLLRPHWDFMVQRLPASSFVCASILQVDLTTYGMEFLQASLSPNRLADFLLSQNNPVDACWCLEGLTRREEAVLDALVNPNTNVLSAVLHILQQQQVSNNLAVLVPLCRSLCHMLSCGNGKLVPVLLNQPGFVPSMVRLLECQSTMEALYVVNCVLTNVGARNHVANTYCPQFVASLLPALFTGTYQWKCGAVSAMANALLPPPGHNNNMCDHSCQTTVIRVLWPDQNVSWQRRQVMEALVDLLQTRGHDHQVWHDAVLILDGILRTEESSFARELFEELGGVDALETVCDSNLPEDTAQRAVSILDDLFGDDGAGEPQVMYTTNERPLAAPPPRDVSHGRGRGRGSVLPAWMQQQQQ